MERRPTEVEVMTLAVVVNVWPTWKSVFELRAEKSPVEGVTLPIGAGLDQSLVSRVVASSPPPPPPLIVPITTRLPPKNPLPETVSSSPLSRTMPSLVLKFRAPRSIGFVLAYFIF